MPLNVELKLYSATLLVRLANVKRAETFALSERKILSAPKLKSNKFRGAILGGFVSSFSAFLA
ncbi:MAG: hypothetical protein ACR2N3_14480 [Pyrinomonadaceae bacterium]